MKELAAKFIGKECLIHTLNTQFSGIIKEVSENGGAMLVEKKDNVEIVNLDYVIRIKEFPKKKNGKKKSVVWDL